MGNGASVTGAPVAQPTAEALRAKLDAIKLEANNETREFDTPRGVSAKAEVERLRALLKTTIEDGVHLEEVLKTIEAPPAEDSEDDGPDERRPCSKCGRKFNPDRVDKHESVCKGDTKKASEGGDGSEPPAADTDAGSEGTNSRPGSSKWKEDRAKMKEQLKKDQEAAKSKKASGDEDEAAGDATEVAVPDGEAPAADAE